MLDIEWQCDQVPLCIVAQLTLAALETELQICLAVHCEGQLAVLHTQHIAAVQPTAHTQQVQIPCARINKNYNAVSVSYRYLF